MEYRIVPHEEEEIEESKKTKKLAAGRNLVLLLGILAEQPRRPWLQAMIGERESQKEDRKRTTVIVIFVVEIFVLRVRRKLIRIAKESLLCEL